MKENNSDTQEKRLRSLLDFNPSMLSDDDKRLMTKLLYTEGDSSYYRMLEWQSETAFFSTCPSWSPY